MGSRVTRVMPFMPVLSFLRHSILDLWSGTGQTETDRQHYAPPYGALHGIIIWEQTIAIAVTAPRKPSTLLRANIVINF